MSIINGYFEKQVSSYYKKGIELIEHRQEKCIELKGAIGEESLGELGEYENTHIDPLKRESESENCESKMAKVSINTCWRISMLVLNLEKKNKFETISFW